MDINAYLKEQLPKSFKKIHLAPDIPEKKLNNAVLSFKYSNTPDTVVGLFDSALMIANGKTGLLFSGDQMILKEFDLHKVFEYKNIDKVEVNDKIINPEKGKTEKSFVITEKDGTVTSLPSSYYYHLDLGNFAILLNDLCNNFTEFKAVKQMVALQDMPIELKRAYIQVIINMSYDNDNLIDAKELAEILSLMTRIQIDRDTRISLRAYMSDIHNLTSTEELVRIITENTPEGQLNTIQISLTKDLINTFVSTTDPKGDITIESLKDFSFFNKYKNLLDISDDELKLIISAIDSDRKILYGDLTDDEITALMKGVVQNAASVGVPIAAVYLSGSVMGLSAAGITSGLATLGFGGILGFSSMVTGIGVAILIGVAAHSGVKKLTGADQLSKSQKREMMLNMVIKSTQKTISELLEDINHISQQLNKLIEARAFESGKIQALTNQLAQYTASGQVLSDKSDLTQGNIAKISSPKFLDLEKLKRLTLEPTKADYYDFIKEHYIEKEFIDTKVEVEQGKSPAKITKLVIKPNQSAQQLEELSVAFNNIDYFSVSSMFKGRLGG